MDTLWHLQTEHQSGRGKSTELFVNTSNVNSKEHLKNRESGRSQSQKAPRYTALFAKLKKQKTIHTTIKSVLARGKGEGIDISYLLTKCQIQLTQLKWMIFTVCKLYSQKLEFSKKWASSNISKFPVWVKPSSIPENVQNSPIVTDAKSQNLSKSAT